MNAFDIKTHRMQTISGTIQRLVPLILASLED